MSCDYIEAPARPRRTGRSRSLWECLFVALSPIYNVKVAVV